MDKRFGIASICIFVLIICSSCQTASVQSQDKDAALLTPSAAPATKIAPPVPTGKPHICGHSFTAMSAHLGSYGTTQVSFQITTEGTVKNVIVTQSCGNKEFDQAAIECASSWAYRPAQKDGRPVEVPWRAAVDWAIQQ